MDESASQTLPNRQFLLDADPVCRAMELLFDAAGGFDQTVAEVIHLIDGSADLFQHPIPATIGDLFLLAPLVA